MRSAVPLLCPLNIILLGEGGTWTERLCLGAEVIVGTWGFSGHGKLSSYVAEAVVCICV